MTNKEIITQWFNKKVQLLVESNPNYQKHKDIICYQFHTKHLTICDPEILSTFGSFTQTLKIRRERTGVNPQTGERIKIPAMEIESCILCVPRDKNNEFIEYIKDKIEISCGMIYGGHGPEFIILDNGRVFDTKDNDRDTVFEYCDVNRYEGCADFLSEIKGNWGSGLYKEMINTYQYSLASDLKDKYDIEGEILDDRDQFSFIENLNDQDVELIINGEKILDN